MHLIYMFYLQYVMQTFSIIFDSLMLVFKKTIIICISRVNTEHFTKIYLVY